MANPHRGEVEVILAGKTHTLRPTFQALAEIENKTGMGLLDLGRNFAAGRFGGQDLTAVIWAGLRGHVGVANAPDYATVGDLVVDEGFTRLAAPVGAFLAALLGGVAQPVREREAADAP